MSGSEGYFITSPINNCSANNETYEKSALCKKRDFALAARSKETFEKLQTESQPKDQDKGLVMSGTMAIYPKDPGKENKDATNFTEPTDVKLEGDFQIVQKEKPFKLRATQPPKLVGKWSDLGNDARSFRDDKSRVKSARKKLTDPDILRSRPPTGRVTEKFDIRRIKMDEGPPFEGPFECQPEYRKARMDMLIKERPPPRKKFEPDMTRLPPLYDSPPQQAPLITRSRPSSRVSSPTTFKLRVVPPSPANKPGHVFTPNALVAPVKEPPIRRNVEFLRRYRSTETETETENEYSEDDGRAFVVLDAPLPGTRRREKLLRKAEICARNNNWMPPWYDRIQR